MTNDHLHAIAATRPRPLSRTPKAQLVAMALLRGVEFDTHTSTAQLRAAIRVADGQR